MVSTAKSFLKQGASIYEYTTDPITSVGACLLGDQSGFELLKVPMSRVLMRLVHNSYRFSIFNMT